MKREKNINVFNSDIKKNGKYMYSDFSQYSARVATKRQTNAILDILEKNFSSTISLLDCGCGDGTFTLELLKSKKVKHIVGFDVAKHAVSQAKILVPKKFAKKVSYTICNMYGIKKKFEKNTFNVAVVRGVLHHLYNPEKAIKQLSFLPYVLVLEPNGYNPVLKLIEKISPYHRKHEEKSYFPPTLNMWYRECGYEVVTQRFVGIVPYFFPSSVAKILNALEPLMEQIPVIHLLYTGSNVILYKNTTFSAK